LSRKNVPTEKNSFTVKTGLGWAELHFLAAQKRCDSAGSCRLQRRLSAALSMRDPAV